MKNYLGIILAKENECEEMEFFLPTQTKVIKRIFEMTGADIDDWHISASYELGKNLRKAVLECRNLTALNYLGYLMYRMNDAKSKSFKEACNLPTLAGKSIEPFINIAIGILRGYSKRNMHYIDKELCIPEKYRILA